MQTLVPILATLLPVAAPAGAATPSLAGGRPNIILILTDDQGYGDLSAHGNPVLKTPHLDRLRAEGAAFTDFHVSPTCSPTRAALLTGCHEFRSGVTHTIFERERLAPGTITLAQALKSAGYATGIFGKWHLGDEEAYQPGQRGFDEVFIHGGGGIGQTYPGSCGDAPLNSYFDPAILHNGNFVKTKGFCTDVFFDGASRWVGSVSATGAPFFAYIATNAPHAPYDARPEDAALYLDKVGGDKVVANFFGMIHNIDENVGRLMALLDERRLAENTLVVFLTDNGSAAGVKVFNAGMRAGKGTPYLGGTRAASFWRWRGRIAPGEIGALAAHIDVFPTLAEIAGVSPDPGVRRQIEGRSLVPLLDDRGAPWAERTLFTHLGRWPRFSDPGAAKYSECAVRTPRWHLVSAKARPQAAWELYDVPADPGERTDVAPDHPDVVRRLSKEYEAWWSGARPGMVNENAVGPRLNPFAEQYWRQFGGGPDAEDLRIMEPSQTGIPRPRQARGGPVRGK